MSGYLIQKKGTNLVECILWANVGDGYEVMLAEKEEYLDKLRIFKSEDEANEEIELKRKFWNEYGGKLGLYLYDDKTLPDDLEVIEINN